jgi:hypothetical protein
MTAPQVSHVIALGCLNPVINQDSKKSTQSTDTEKSEYDVGSSKSHDDLLGGFEQDCS